MYWFSYLRPIKLREGVKMGNIRGSEWHKWDLHLHTASSYDYSYKGEEADEILCQMLKDNEISCSCNYRSFQN